MPPPVAVSVNPTLHSPGSLAWSGIRREHERLGGIGRKQEISAGEEEGNRGRVNQCGSVETA